MNNGSSREIQMVITYHSEVRYRSIIYRDARNWATEALEKIIWSLLFPRRSDSGASHIETLELEQRKLLRNSNGLNFSLGALIQAHHIYRRSKLNNESSPDILMVITFNLEVRFWHIIYRDARNWTTEALEKIKWSLLLTRRSDSSTSHIETLEIEQRKFSRYSNDYNF